MILLLSRDDILIYYYNTVFEAEIELLQQDYYCASYSKNYITFIPCTVPLCTVCLEFTHKIFHL
jgi:hypothetical protein